MIELTISFGLGAISATFLCMHLWASERDYYCKIIGSQDKIIRKLFSILEQKEDNE